MKLVAQSGPLNTHVPLNLTAPYCPCKPLPEGFSWSHMWTTGVEESAPR